MKILITGANGYIGSHVAKYISQNTKHTVIAVDFNNDKIQNLNNIEYTNIDVLANASNPNLYKTLKEPDALIHFAWRDGFKHDSDAHLFYLGNHYLFLKNMIDSGCKNINVMGTMHEVGYYTGEINENTPCNPMSLYGIAKNSLRQALLIYSSGKDISVKWLRAFYITGDDYLNHSVFAKILEMAKTVKRHFRLFLEQISMILLILKNLPNILPVQAPRHL